MNFERVLSEVLAGFERQKIRYAAIGGFALGALGVPRATMDLDFLVHREDLPRLHDVLSTLGYRRGVHTENVSHDRHPDRSGGAMDILHAFRSFALTMLERAQPHPMLGTTRTVRVVLPEDLIGLKVQPMANDPLRESHERADIESLLARYGQQLDWSHVQQFYDLFDRGEEARTLKERYKDAQ